MMQGDWVKKSTGDCTVVFIHGILSSAETCWRHENGTYWPEVIASEKELESEGVYVFSYKTGFFSGTYRLGNAVDSLKEHLRLDGVLESKKIIFVCHSMGGLVARKFIVERSTDFAAHGTKLGLFLVASPSLGADLANWLAPLARFFGHAQADALRFSQNNAWLLDLDKEFMNAKEGKRLSIVGKELVEDNFVVLKSLLKKQVVEPFSGARYFGEAYKVPDSDHFSIAKIENASAIQHKLLVDFILNSSANSSVLPNSEIENSDKPDTDNKSSKAKTQVVDQNASAGSGSTIIQVGRDYTKQ